MPREFYGHFEQMWLEVIKLLGIILIGVGVTAITLCLLAIWVSDLYERRMIRRDRQRDDGPPRDFIDIRADLITPGSSLLKQVYMADEDNTRT